MDKVLDPEQKKMFYGQSASTVKAAVDRYAKEGVQATARSTKPLESFATGGKANYGQMGLNRVVNQISKSTQEAKEVVGKTRDVLKTSLDDFLANENESNHDTQDLEAFLEAPTQNFSPSLQLSTDEALNDSLESQHQQKMMREMFNELRSMLKTQQHRIENLEQKLIEVGSNSSPKMPELISVHQLKNSLMALEVDGQFVIELIKKASSQLTAQELDNTDYLFEYALKEMTDSLHVEHALFTHMTKPVITVLLSEGASGQTTMSYKLAVLQNSCEVIHFDLSRKPHILKNLASDFLSIKNHTAKDLPELMQICRQSLEQKKSIVIDFKVSSFSNDDAKKIIDSLKRGFEDVEILGNISAIHSELYNRKIISRYKDLIDGIIISHVDMCLNFGALFNIHKHQPKLPMKFFGTGPMVPDDVESASAERIMAGLFQLT